MEMLSRASLVGAAVERGFVLPLAELVEDLAVLRPLSPTLSREGRGGFPPVIDRRQRRAGRYELLRRLLGAAVPGELDRPLPRGAEALRMG